MLLSIVIPVYNEIEFLERCVSRLLAEPIAEKEILVVDDGSTKDISASLRKFSVIPFRLEQNRGPSAARNFGVSKATGRYIYFAMQMI